MLTSSELSAGQCRNCNVDRLDRLNGPHNGGPLSRRAPRSDQPQFFSNGNYLLILSIDNAPLVASSTIGLSYIGITSPNKLTLKESIRDSNFEGLQVGSSHVTQRFSVTLLLGWRNPPPSFTRCQKRIGSNQGPHGNYICC